MQNQNRRAQPMSGTGNFPAPVQRQPLQPMVPATRPNGWLRTVATLGMPGLVILFFLGLMQVFAPYDWKPTVMIGKAIAQYEVTVIQDTLMDRAEAERQIALARTEGERISELAFQADLRAIEFDYAQQLATVQTNLQTSMNAYQSLYERTNQIYQGALQMEGTILAQQQAAVRDTQSGQAFLANGADLLCPLMPELCQVSDRIREDMAGDLVTAGRTGRGSVMRDMLMGVEDPASLRARLMPQEPASVLPQTAGM